jgi:ribulose-bisphosphate carboxylase small chain
MTAAQMTQGAFSYLPALTDDEITMQVERAIGRGWTLAIEHTDGPSPRNHYWEMFGPPQFDDLDSGAVVAEVNRCRAAFPEHYIKVNALDPRVGRQTIALSFIVHRPGDHA